MAVLSDREIEKKLTKVFGDTADPKRIRAAKYSLRLGDRFLILPSGERYGDEGYGPARCTRFTLKPGQTALLSTMERLAMPRDLMGLLGPTFEFVDNGVLFLGGTIVDPGFGLKLVNGNWVVEREPLSFHVANIGSNSVELRPGEDQVASVAFLELVRPRKEHKKFPKRFAIDTARKMRAEEFDRGAPIKKRRTDLTMGLVEDISVIRERVDKFEASTMQVVLFGVIVLAATLFAAMVALVTSEPAAHTVSSLNLWKVLLTTGAVILEVAALVGLFYLMLPCFGRFRRKWKDRKASAGR